MKFKNAQDEQDWNARKFHATLYEVAERAEESAEKLGWKPLLVTSGIRSHAEDSALHGSGIHCTGRAIDVRTTSVQPFAVADLTLSLNEGWIYDPDRPTLPVAYSGKHGTASHLHLQVCDRTRARG